MGVWKSAFAVVLTVCGVAANAAAQGVRPAVYSSLDDEGFRGAVFAPPGTGFGILSAGGQLPEPRPVPTELPPPAPLPEPEPAPPVLTQFEDFVGDPELRSPPWRTWFGAEVLLGMSRPVNVPPLVTTGPASDGVFTAGALGQPNTVPLFGGRKMLGDWRGGLRTEGGYWFDRQQTWGVVGRFYSLYSTSDQLVGVTNGTNVVNLPQFFAVGGTLMQVPAYASFPGLTTGTVSATAQTMFAGGDLSLRGRLRENPRWRLDGLFGYRQMFLHDELGREFTAAGVAVPPGTAFASGADNLRTRNHFFGSNVGAIATLTRDRWTLEGLAAVALGANVSDLDFDQNRFGSAAGVGTVPPVANRVRSETTYFGVVGEGGVRAAFRVTDRARLTFGYTCLYWWNVRRAQEQFALGTAPAGGTTHYYAHMLSWGADFRY
jgi:hypothetical protein